ncbi:carboxypeptidase-like regulatory domain-containing protein [Enhygromyxa salina]|nr:carboxypeptidase-like regulatory domain-containing protein [Enhygromyxa salina]
MSQPIATKKRVRLFAAMLLAFAVLVSYWWRSGPPEEREVGADPATMAEHKSKSWIVETARDDLELRLDAGPMLTGVVVVAPSLELDGEITVCGRSALFSSGPVVCTTADQDGRFRIPASQFLDTQIHVCMVGASAPGAEPSESIRTRCEGELPKPLFLSHAGKSVAGTVADHFGGPVAGARVFGDTQSAVGALALTDDAGRFELWTANGQLFVSASGYGSVLSRGPLPDSDRRIELYPEAAVEGTVRESDGTSRDGVQVELHSRVGAQVTKSNAEGQFLFTGLGPGDFELRAVDGARGAGPTHLRVPMGETVVQDLTLEPRATVRGWIGFASGVDCTSVSHVELASLGKTPSHKFVTQQVGAEAAQYSIAGVPVGNYEVLAACAQATRDIRDTVTVTATEETTHDLVFEERAASIFGYLAGRTDPSQRFIVIARRDLNDLRTEADANYRLGEVTDAGEFSVGPVGEGTWRLQALPYDSLGNVMHDGSGTAVVVEHDDVTDVKLIPSTDEWKVELLVLHEGGEAAKGQSVRANSPGRFVRMCTTGGDGACEISLPDEPSDEEMIFSAPQRIWCDGEWRKFCQMSLADGVVHLVIEGATTSLNGRLTEINDGTGVSFAEISAVRIGDGNARTYTMGSTRTEEDGTFVLNGLPADDGTLRLEVTCPTGQRPPIHVPFGATPSISCDEP